MNIFKDKKNLVIIALTIVLIGVLYFAFHKSKDAKNTDALIMNICEVTLDKESVIENARASYDALSDSHKKQVDHLDILIGAESQYQLLYDKNEAEKADALIREANAEDKASIDRARKAYDHLTEAQKQYCMEYNSLLTVEEEYSKLQARKFDESSFDYP